MVTDLSWIVFFWRTEDILNNLLIKLYILFDTILVVENEKWLIFFILTIDTLITFHHTNCAFDFEWYFIKKKKILINSTLYKLSELLNQLSASKSPIKICTAVTEFFFKHNIINILSLLPSSKNLILTLADVF